MEEENLWDSWIGNLWAVSIGGVWEGLAIEVKEDESGI